MKKSFSLMEMVRTIFVLMIESKRIKVEKSIKGLENDAVNTSVYQYLVVKLWIIIRNLRT